MKGCTVIPSAAKRSRGTPWKIPTVIPRDASTPLGMTRNRTLAIFFCLIFGMALSVFAQPDAEFAKANQAFAQGHFKEAIANYETLIRDGQWSANVFYDLGNAYFRTGDFGRAILNYERALALERHLQFATINQYSIAAAVAFWLAIFGMATLIFARRRSTTMIVISIGCLLVSGVAICSVYTLDRGSKGRALAIITGKDVQARLATADTANAVLALPSGSEIKVLSTRGDWIYAALPNNL